MNEIEVYFDDYCPLCEHSSKTILEQPCNECQSEPTRLDSHKPVLFKEKE